MSAGSLRSLRSTTTAMAKPTLLQSLFNRPSQSYTQRHTASPRSSLESRHFHSVKDELFKAASQVVPLVASVRRALSEFLAYLRLIAAREPCAPRRCARQRRRRHGRVLHAEHVAAGVRLRL